MRRKICFLVLVTVLMALVLTGCLVRSTDELYALPRQSEEYHDLQKAIDGILGSGGVYSAPKSGSNQQAVQLADLDGDGEDEAIVFIRTTGERPLKACILDRTEDAYEQVAVIEGDGSAFDSVDYVQVDGKPGLEILLGRQISDQVLQSLTVSSYTDGRVVERMYVNYSEYLLTDLDMDGCTDLFVLRLETEERAGVAELYRSRDGQIYREPEATLSTGAKSIKRIITGQMSSGIPAVFVASTYEEDTIVTDIFAFWDQTFCNVSKSGETGLSVQTVRNYHVYAADIDDDGLIELPMLEALPSTSAEEAFWSIQWYNLHPNGKQIIKMTTYHNYLGGWYLELPGNLDGRISMSRSPEVSGVRGYRVEQWKGPDVQPEEIFTIYAFTGDDRVDLAMADGRFLLAEKSDTAYCACFGTSKLAAQLTQEDLSAMFHFIRMDWNSGER